jgi:membrane-associated phospholipid phosphatase
MKRIYWALFGILSFVVPYILINNFSLSRAGYHLILPIDYMIPFVPSFVIFYMLTFVYVIVVPYIIIKDENQFAALSLSFIFTMFLGYITFLLFPVKTVLRPENLTNGFFTGLVKLSYLADAPGFNNFPSLHVALSLLASLIIYQHDKKHWWVWIMFAGITLSTMLIKQHYFIDAVAGILLGIIGYLVYLWLRKPKLL